MQPDVGLAVAAPGQPGGEEAAGFVAVDGPVALAGHVAVAGVDLDGRAAVADAEFDELLGRLRSGAPAVLLFALALPDGGDLAVDALDPQGVPDAHSVESRLSTSSGRPAGARSRRRSTRPPWVRRYRKSAGTLWWRPGSIKFHGQGVLGVTAHCFGDLAVR